MGNRTLHLCTLLSHQDSVLAWPESDVLSDQSYIGEARPHVHVHRPLQWVVQRDVEHELPCGQMQFGHLHEDLFSITPGRDDGMSNPQVRPWCTSHVNWHRGIVLRVDTKLGVQYALAACLVLFDCVNPTLQLLHCHSPSPLQAAQAEGQNHGGVRVAADENLRSAACQAKANLCRGCAALHADKIAK